MRIRMCGLHNVDADLSRLQLLSKATVNRHKAADTVLRRASSSSAGTVHRLGLLRNTAATARLRHLMDRLVDNMEPLRQVNTAPLLQASMVPRPKLSTVHRLQVSMAHHPEANTVLHPQALQRLQVPVTPLVKCRTWTWDRQRTDCVKP